MSHLRLNLAFKIKFLKANSVKDTLAIFARGEITYNDTVINSKLQFERAISRELVMPGTQKNYIHIKHNSTLHNVKSSNRSIL